jgi:hypothetical protein
VEADYCPEGSTAKKNCPTDEVCSLAVSCADGSTPNLWYNTPIANGGGGGVGADLSTLPDCMTSALTATIVDAGLMRLSWGDVNCTEFDKAFTATSVNGFATRSYVYSASMKNINTGSTFSATMEGNLATIEFINFFSVPFGTSVEFTLTLDVQLAVQGTYLCVIESMEMARTTKYMTPEPAKVSVITTLSSEVAGRVDVAWEVEGESSDIVEFDVYTDRFIQGMFLEITQAQVDGSLREAAVDVTAGYEYQFRVRSKNSLFGGEVMASSIRVPCPSGNSDSHGLGCSPCPVGTHSNVSSATTSGGGEDAVLLVCVSCAANTVSTGGASACDACADHTTANGGQSACVPCQSGHHRESGMDSCELCPKNQVGSGDGCEQCSNHTIANSGQSACVPCQSGHHRESGMDSCELCPGNQVSYGSGDGCEECSAGSLANEAKSTCIPCKSCPEGSRVVAECSGVTRRDRRCEACPGGSYQDQPNQHACLDCPPGYFCSDGATQKSTCQQGTFCGGNATLPTVLQAGYMQVDGQGDYVAIRAHSEAPCPAGSYCENGMRHECVLGEHCPNAASSRSLCAEGYFCSTPSTSVRCSDGAFCPEGSVVSQDCPAGYFCATSSRKVPCGKGTFCPLRSILPRGLRQGHYAVDVNQTLVVELAVNELVCPAGSHCSAGDRTTCEAGHFCTIGAPLATKARAGYYTADFAGKFVEEGAVEEKLCPAGSYCMEGNDGSSYRGVSILHCEIGHYCPEGASVPTIVRARHYASDASGRFVGKGAVEERLCPAGSYCADGIITPCTTGSEPELLIPIHNPPGCTFDCAMFDNVTWGEVDDCAVVSMWQQGDGGGDSHCMDDCSPEDLGVLEGIRDVLCNQRDLDYGSYESYGKEAVSADAETTEVAGIAQYCPAGSVVPEMCEPGSYCPTPESQLECGDGYFCPVGGSTQQQCPEGHFCPTPASRSVCPEGTYCPAGSILPQSVRPGHFAVDKSGDATVTEAIMDAPCPAGWHCVGGNKIKCDFGKYCPEESVVQVACPKGSVCSADAAKRQECEPGTYCPEGTVLEAQVCAEGAMCANPSQPELIFDPASIAVRESDIARNDQWSISYTVKLSAPPAVDKRVTVRIEKGDPVSVPECVKYEDGLALEGGLAFLELVFDRSNFNTSQTVTVGVRRKQSNDMDKKLYQGSSRAFFVHDVKSSDPAWVDTTKRSMSVFVEDDSPCTTGAQKKDDDSTGVRKCTCAEGYFEYATDSSFCGSVTKCVECPLGMICGTNQQLDEAMLEGGKYREVNTSLVVVDCPILAACEGNATFGNDLCREGHEGPLCMICSKGYVWDGINCVTCTSGQNAMLTTMGVMLGLGLVVVAFLLWPRAGNSEAEGTKSNLRLCGEAFAYKAFIKYKIVITFVQILSKVSSIYPMNLPPNFSTYQETVNPFASLDITLIPLNCVVEVNFHSKLQMMTLAPLAFLGWVALTYAVMHGVLVLQHQSRNRIQVLQSKALYIAIVCLYSVFPLVSAVIFQTVSYDRRLEPYEYLKADYSVESGDDAHQSNIVFAAVMGVVYMVGIPAASYMVLRTKQTKIQEYQKLMQSVMGSAHDSEEHIRDQKKYDQMDEEDPFLVGLAPLFKDYESKYWWWEIPRFFCTLVLCGLVTVTKFQDGSQIATSLFVSTVMLVAYANCNPYLINVDDKLAQFCQASLSLAMAVGLLEKANNASAADDASQSSSSFGFVLIACVTVNLVVGIGGVLFDALQTFQMFLPEPVGRFFKTKTSRPSSRMPSSRRASSRVSSKILSRPQKIRPQIEGVSGERLSARENDKHRLKGKQMTAAVLPGPSLAVAADASLPSGPRAEFSRRGSGIEAIVAAKIVSRKVRKSTAKRAEL